MPVPLAEIKGALHGVPVLSLFKAVAHEDLFVHRGADHRFGMAAHLRGGKHFVHDDERSRTRRVVIVCRVKEEPFPAALHRVRVDGKGRDQIAAIGKRPLRRFADRNDQPLAVIVRTVGGHTGYVQIIFSVDVRHGRRPVFLVPFPHVTKARKLPMKLVAAHIQLNPFDVRRIHIIFPVCLYDIGIGLTSLARQVQFHNLLPITEQRRKRLPTGQSASALRRQSARRIISPA